MTSLSVPDDAAGERLDRWLAGALVTPDGQPVSRAKVQRMLEAGDVTVNGAVVPAKHPLTPGERVEVRWAKPAPSPLTPVAMALSILYEDDQLVVVDKPAGISVHPGAGDTGPTLVQGLLHHCALSSGGEAMRPGIVHRLDKDTSGALVVAKTDAAHAALAKQFHDKTNQREYVALLDGAMAQAEIVHESYLHRDPKDRLKFASMTKAAYDARVKADGREPTGFRYARSRFLRENTFASRLTLARVRLFTGRTHQIRVHAVDLRLPIVGDPVYNRPTQLPSSFTAEVREGIRKADRQMLHARLLGFRHPTSGQELQFTAPYPEDFRRLIALLAPYAQAPIRLEEWT